MASVSTSFVEAAMYTIVNKAAQVATIQYNLTDEPDRQAYIAYLKSLQPTSAVDQFDIDKCIQAAGGEPDSGFPGYEFMQQ